MNFPSPTWKCGTAGSRKKHQPPARRRQTSVFPTLSSRPRWVVFFLFAARNTPSSAYPTPPTTPGPSPSLSSPGPSATADSGVGQKPTIGVWCRPPFLRSRSTVNCVLCPAMQMCRDQSRRDGTTPMRGLFPKPTAAPYNGQGFPWSSSFLWETQKNHDGLIFSPLGLPLGPPSAPPRPFPPHPPGPLLFFGAVLRLATPVC